MTRRLLLTYLSVTLFVLLLLELPLAVFFRQREMDRLSADVERDAAVLATIYEDALEGDMPADPAPAAKYRSNTGARVVVVDADGISVLDTDEEPDRDFSTRPEFEEALTGIRSTGTRFSETLDTDLLYVAVPVASGGNVHGALRLTVDTREVTERVRRFWLGLVAVAAVVLAAVAAIGWALARSVTRPVRRLQATAARFSDGDLTRSPPDSGAPPELRDLAEAMNDMATRLDHLIGEQRAFVADASHQLRTPLTALRLRLENLHSSIDDETQAREIDAAIDEITRLAQLVSGLLQLARADKAPAPVPCDVAQLARDRVDTWTAVADQHGLLVELVAVERSIWALVVPGGVEQILDNLLDNAVNASPAGSTVVVRVAPCGRGGRGGSGSVLLEVADAGRGLDDAQKSRALERFWQGEVGATGTGLGLAIVASLVSASNGTVELVDNEPHGLVVGISLPAASPEPAW